MENNRLDIICPFCDSSLMDNTTSIDGAPSIHLLVETEESSGWLRLSSVFGSFTTLSEYPVKDGEETTLKCPECESVFISRLKCHLCGSHMSYLHLAKGGKVHFCSKKGCKSHILEED